MRSSTWRKFLIGVLAASSIAASAQSVRVYSPFTRVDPFGEVVPPDRGSSPPREILSPVLVRNAWNGYHLVVEAPPGMAYNVYVGLNPERAVDVRLYRERYVRDASGVWIPDELEAVELPYRGHMETEGIPGQTAQSFWLDLHVAADAVVQRIKVEPQVSFDDRWARYPMEARIAVTVAPKTTSATALAPVAAPSDVTYRRVLRCPSTGGAPNLTVRGMIARDAARDAAIAPNTDVGAAGDPSTWCTSETHSPAGPEWVLRLRDKIINSPR